jgi:hypothetical protein
VISIAFPKQLIFIVPLVLSKSLESPQRTSKEEMVFKNVKKKQPSLKQFSVRRANLLEQLNITSFKQSIIHQSQSPKTTI